MQTAGLTCAYSMVPGFASVLAMVPATSDPQHITIDCVRADGPLTHYWEECVGSDRAIVGLRQQWLTDLEQVKREAGFRSVRFHGLFNDEMGVWPGASPAPNFLYVDMVFDAMLERGSQATRRTKLHAGRAGQREEDSLLLPGKHHPSDRDGPVG